MREVGSLIASAALWFGLGAFCGAFIFCCGVRCGEWKYGRVVWKRREVWRWFRRWRGF